MGSSIPFVVALLATSAAADGSLRATNTIDLAKAPIMSAAGIVDLTQVMKARTVAHAASSAEDDGVEEEEEEKKEEEEKEEEEKEEEEEEEEEEVENGEPCMVEFHSLLACMGEDFINCFFANHPNQNSDATCEERVSFDLDDLNECEAETETVGGNCFDKAKAAETCLLENYCAEKNVQIV